MKLVKLVAVGVFKTLDFNLSFKDQLTFLTGINGSGKTTAIRLLLAITTPSLRQLDELPHESASVHIRVNDQDIVISSSVSESSITLKISGIQEELSCPRVNKDAYHDRVRPDEGVEEHYSILEEKFSTHPVIQYLTSIDTPVFLGIERKQQSAALPSRGNVDRYLPDRVRVRRRTSFRGNLGASLQEVQALTQEIFGRIRRNQDRISQKLREDILLSAFSYEPILNALRLEQLEPPTWKDDELIRVRKQEVENAFTNLRIPDEIFRPVINQFFDRLSGLTKIWIENKTDSPEFIEWLINKPQIDRITRIFQIVEEYNEKLRKFMAPVDKYLSLVNRFLTDSNKELAIDPVGWLVVKLHTKAEESVAALSSGERQIVVMLGHLALSESMRRAGIFIVDEPELSLHLKWQEKFVASILEASPSTQFILATHSPAIVLNRQDDCITLST